MRLLRQDPATGLLKLRIETPSDLWRLARLIRPGEKVGASTTRRDPEAPAEAPAAHRERRRIYLAVRAEQVEFHGFSHHVRVTGPILEGPFDLGRHHTLDLAEGEVVDLEKLSLAPAERALLDEGLAARGEPVLVVAMVDWGESTLARLRGRAVDVIADVNRTLAGKRFPGGQGDKDRTAYVGELLRTLEPELEAAAAIVLAGPGFLKEELARRVAEAHPSAKSKLRLVPTAEAGRAGLDELLRSGKATEALQGSVAALEADLVEQLIARLGGGRRAAVGLDEVREATAAGAPEIVLVSESWVADPKVAEVLEGVRTLRARLFIVRDEGSAGRRLAGLGKIAALLRFDWTPAHPRGGGPTGSPGPPRAAPPTGGGGP